MKMMLLLATTLAALGSPLQAQAQEGQSIWRCGADGRSYSATPCAEGRQLASADPRPHTDVKAAQDIAQRERLLGHSLAKERQHREAAVRAVGHRRRCRPGRPGPQAGSGIKETTPEPEAPPGFAAWRRWYLASSWAGVSTQEGLTGMQLTGHSCTHCGVSKWPTHSVQRFGSIS